MTLYQELQLNQAGSKQLIRNTQDKKEKARHIAVYLFKILLTLAFCVAFVTVYTKVFGSDNSIVGVVARQSSPSEHCKDHPCWDHREQSPEQRWR